MKTKRGFFGFLSLMIMGAAPVFADTALPVCSSDLLTAETGPASCRWQGHGRLIHLARPGAGAQPGALPVLFITGGPGAYSAPSLAYVSELATRLGRPVILPDIYGTDPSGESLQAGLTCHAGDRRSTGPWGIAASADAAEIYTRADQERSIDACLAQINLTPDRRDAMSTGATARDYRALRQFLGIERWQVVAESYGARVALKLAEADGAALDRLVLDSPELPWADTFHETGGNLLAALKALGDICRDTYRCVGRRLRLERDLPAKIATLVPENLDAVAIRDAQTGNVAAYARLTQEQMLIRVYNALRFTRTAEMLPYIAVAYNVSDMQKRFTILLQGLLRSNDDLSFSLYHSVRCSEVPLGRWYDSLAAESRKHPELRPLFDYLGWRQRYVCRALGIEPPERIDAAALPDRPVLILSGEFDPVTPPATVTEAFGALGINQRHVTYAASGHAVARQRGCALADMAAFLQAPDASALPAASSCRKDDLKLRFYSSVQIR